MYVCICAKQSTQLYLKVRVCVGMGRSEEGGGESGRIYVFAYIDLCCTML